MVTFFQKLSANLIEERITQAVGVCNAERMFNFFSNSSSSLLTPSPPPHPPPQPLDVALTLLIRGHQHALAGAGLFRVCVVPAFGQLGLV